MKLKLRWQDHLYTLLMRQPITEDNVLNASCAVGAWFGEKTSTMSQEDFDQLLEQAVEELTTWAWETRAEHVEIEDHETVQS
jgi:hypothetical protein